MLSVWVFSKSGGKFFQFFLKLVVHKHVSEFLRHKRSIRSYGLQLKKYKIIDSGKSSSHSNSSLGKCHKFLKYPSMDIYATTFIDLD